MNTEDNLNSLLTEEALINDDIKKSTAALENAKQKLKNLQANIELHSSSLTSATNKKTELLQLQWQILNQHEQQSRERTKEKMYLMIMQDQQKNLLETLESEKGVGENMDCNNFEYLNNRLNETILKRKMYELLHELEQEIGNKEDHFKKFLNYHTVHTLENH